MAGFWNSLARATVSCRYAAPARRVRREERPELGACGVSATIQDARGPRVDERLWGIAAGISLGRGFVAGCCAVEALAI